MAILQKTCAWCNKTLYSNDPLCFACWQTFKIKPRSMLTRPKARNASTAALQVSLNIPIKTKSAPKPDPEPAPTPEAEDEPESPRKSEIDTVNAALRSVLVELHERDAARRECSQCLDDVIDRVIADEERRVVEEARSDAERSFGAWSHTQPPGTAIVRGYNNVQDVARACGLNVHAPVFVPMANSPFSAFHYG